MIIGISGRIGSGKDTIGKIIQYLSVRGGPGPLTIEEFLRARYDPIAQSGWEIRKFADKLKEIASLLTGIPRAEFEDQEFKKTFLGPEWNYWAWPEDGEKYASKEDYMMAIATYQGTSFDEVDISGLKEYQMSVRQFLQRLGTEGIRDGVHPQAWINAAFCNDDTGKSLIFTDMRFPNEMKAIEERQGVTIRIERSKFMSADNIAGPGGTHVHPSEVALDNAEFNYVIDNSGTLSDLVEIVRGILADIKEKAAQLSD